MSLTAADLCEKLALGDAHLRALLEEHIRDNDELLPHVFFGDVTRYYEALCKAGRREQAARIVATLDETLAETPDDSYISGVIHTSFLWALPWQKAGLHWELLTPRLRVGYARMQGHSDPS